MYAILYEMVNVNDKFSEGGLVLGYEQEVEACELG